VWGYNRGMGKHADISKETRLMHIHRLLAAGTYVTCESLAEKMGVSTKTAQRDLADLNAEMGGKIRWDRGLGSFKYTEPVTLLARTFIAGEEEVTAFLMAHAMMKHFSPLPLAKEMERLSQVLMSEKYNAMGPNKPNPNKYSFVHQRMAKVDPQIWSICTRALNRCHKLDIVYHKIGEKPERRRIVPLHMKGAKGGWYLISFCELKNEQRTFFMSRVLEAEDTGEEFSPANYTFDPHMYFRIKTDVFKAGAFYECEVRLKGWAVERTREVVYFAGQKLTANPDGSATLRFETEDIYSAAAYVMEMAGNAKALKPKALVDKVRENISALAKTHKP
jgi:predicted DNA-binding transcriptional regulator YafY